MPHFKLVEGGMCRKGLHVVTADTIRTQANGRRLCVECIRINDRKRYVRDRDKRNAANNRWYREQDETTKRAQRLKKYGLTVERYESLLASQRGCCAICSTDAPGGRWGSQFAVDHDHATGAVRGLLCSHCNVMLGNAQDDPARLRGAADYLETNR